MDRIINIFFNEVLKEASTGRVNCGGLYQNILLETKINNKTLYKVNKEIKHNNDFFIPTLNINNLDLLIKLLKEYYITAKSFIDIDEEDIDQDKYILSNLLNNLTIEDMNNFELYVQNCTKSLINKPLNINESNIGFNKELESDIIISIKKEPINQETPYGLYVKSVKEDNFYDFPIVRFNIIDDTAVIYAVQYNKKFKNNIDNNDYQKKIYRKLFKVNKNFEKEKNIDNIENPENITGISPSALVSLTICLSLLENKGIKKVKIPTFLPIRYNAKEMSYLVKESKMKEKGIPLVKLKNEFHKSQQEHEEIQRNISDKFLRYFRRLEYVFDNIKISSYPFELDSSAHLKINEFHKSNNPFLEELYIMGLNYNMKKDSDFNKTI